MRKRSARYDGYRARNAIPLMSLSLSLSLLSELLLNEMPFSRGKEKKENLIVIFPGGAAHASREFTRGRGTLQLLKSSP